MQKWKDSKLAIVPAALYKLCQRRHELYWVITNYPLPITHSPLPITHYPLPSVQNFIIYRKINF
ncbi:MAG: hypothetical protein ACK47A_06155 [Dolichospermum sp.]